MFLNGAKFIRSAAIFREWTSVFSVKSRRCMSNNKLLASMIRSVRGDADSLLGHMTSLLSNGSTPISVADPKSPSFQLPTYQALVRISEEV